MESRGCPRSHSEFKDVFGMVTRGAYFALVSFAEPCDRADEPAHRAEQEARQVPRLRHHPPASGHVPERGAVGQRCRCSGQDSAPGSATARRQERAGRAGVTGRIAGPKPEPPPRTIDLYHGRPYLNATYSTLMYHMHIYAVTSSLSPRSAVNDDSPDRSEVADSTGIASAACLIACWLLRPSKSSTRRFWRSEAE